MALADDWPNTNRPACAAGLVALAEAAKPPNDAAALGAADEFVLKLKPPADGAVVVTGAAVALPNAPKLVAVVVVGVARKLKPAVVPTLLALDAGVVDEKLKPVAAGAPAAGAAAGLLLLLNAPNSELLAPAVVAPAAVAVVVTTEAALVPLLNSDGALGALLPTLPKIPVPAPLATLLAVVVTSGTERVAPEPNTNPAVDEKSADAALSLSPSALGAE